MELRESGPRSIPHPPERLPNIQQSVSQKSLTQPLRNFVSLSNNPDEYLISRKLSAALQKV